LSYHVVWREPSVSKEHIASIVRVGE
jgi:hypothetical protein